MSSGTRTVAPLIALPPHVLIDILSGVTHSSQHLAGFGTVCRGAQETLQEESAWWHLCKKYWFATEERLQEWPAFSPQGLYRALEQWVPLEGYYVLAPMFPWGLLVLLRMSSGRVCADVIRFVPTLDGTARFQEVSVPLFELALTEERPGILQGTFQASWMKGIADVSNLDPQELCAHTNAAHHFERVKICKAKLFTARRALRVQPARTMASKSSAADLPDDRASLAEEAPYLADEDEGYDSEDESVPHRFIEDVHVAGHGRLFDSPEAAHKHTVEMLGKLLRKRAAPCDLALIRSPQDFVPQDPSIPLIRPGLYVGDYGHSFYGQFRTEVLLLEYVTLSPEEIAREAEQPTLLFARPAGQPAPPELAVLAGLGEAVTFVRGVKQCGDLHVCMGATTFIAVCGPVAACKAMEADKRPPATLFNRQSRQQERTVDAWRGFGTLAAPGFRDPSWAGGWLVKFTNDESTGVLGDNRFGFAWDRDQDAIVLQWIRAQDTSPFLQRAWLPEDLR